MRSPNGRLQQRNFETKEGEKRTSIEIEVDEIGPSLKYATVSRGFTKSEGSSKPRFTDRGRGRCRMRGRE